jgi:hypothetical protein
MSGRRRDEDLAYGSYPTQDESQDGEEGERGFVGDTLNSLLGRRPGQGQQSVCEQDLSSIDCKVTHSHHRIPLKPTSRNCTASSSNPTVDHPLVTVNPHQDNNDRPALHLAGPFFSTNSRVLYMTSVRNSRPSCQAHQKSIATLIRVGNVRQAITMAI